MPQLCRQPVLSLLLILALGLVACQEKPAKKPPAGQSAPATLNPGMRAYIDPATGEYAPAPPATEQPKPLAPAAGLVTPEAAPTPREIPLPDGGVMIELGDQFQTEGRAAR